VPRHSRLGLAFEALPWGFTICCKELVIHGESIGGPLGSSFFRVGEGGKATLVGAPDADILLEAIEEL